MIKPPLKTPPRVMLSKFLLGGFIITAITSVQSSFAYEYITAKGITHHSLQSEPKNYKQKDAKEIVSDINSAEIKPIKKRINQTLFKKTKNRCLKNNKFQTIIKRMSRKYKVNADLVTAVIAAESCFKAKIVSPKGAEGLMQLMPFTAKRFGVYNSFDPMQNIMGGVKYLRFLIAYFKGDLRLAVAAYNAGEGAVNRYKGIPPYKETRNYVKKVMAMLGDSTFSGLQKGTFLKASLKVNKVNNPTTVTSTMIKKKPKQKAKRAHQTTQNCIASEQLRRYTYEVFQGKLAKRYYLAKQGETLAIVANKMGVDVLKLKNLNQKTSTDSSISNSVLVWECLF